MNTVSASRDPFYLGMSVFFLIVVLAGFTRSFYLTSYFDFPSLPPHLLIHGTVLTMWFVLACAQPLLISIRNVRLHRRAGIAGMIIAIAVVATGVWTVALRDAPQIDEFPSAGAPNLASLLMFLFCVALGFRFRRKAEHHKRLMLMASIPILAPALDRVGRIPSLNDLFGKILYWFDAPPEVAFAFLSFLTLLLAVVIHDLVRDRRVHHGTLWALLAIIVVAPLATALFMTTGAWVPFVKWTG